MADRGVPVPTPDSRHPGSESPVPSPQSRTTGPRSPVSPSPLPRLIIIQGPTATGKSELAVRLAEEFNGEIVGADSLQLYRGMVIGTAAPGPELTSRIPHHLIGIVDPDATFTAADFAREAGEAIAGILGRGRTPFVVGGTGLYLRVLLGGLIQAPAGDDELRGELAAWADRDGSAALLGELARIITDSGQIFITSVFRLDDFEAEKLKLLNEPSETCSQALASTSPSAWLTTSTAMILPTILSFAPRAETGTVSVAKNSLTMAPVVAWSLERARRKQVA